MSYFNLLHNSLWIIFPTKTFLILYPCCASYYAINRFKSFSALLALVVLLPILNFHFTIIRPSCRYFVLLLEKLQFLLRFPFRNPVHVFSCEISPVCRLKYLYRCYSSHFCFLVFAVFLSVLMLLLLLLADVIRFS